MFIEARDLLAPAADAAPMRMPLAASSAQFSVYVTRDDGEVREAQALRYKVFSEEMGAHLAESTLGIDEDIYDRYCDHLIVRDNATLRVVGTYRILQPVAAHQLGYYSDTEFFTTRLDHLKPLMCEFGRSCVHPDYRSGRVIMQLWAGLAQYMISHGYEHVIGCASISMRDGGHQAASLFNRLRNEYLATEEYRVFPRNPLPLDKLHDRLEVEAPPLIKGYLRVGAQICGDPAWDPDFNSADFFMLLSLSRMNRRYARHFGVRTAVAKPLAK
jgi:putative hemolysin